MTVNEFILRLQMISENKRNLPIVIDAPNGLELTPYPKMRWDNTLEMFEKQPDKIVITWE